MKIKKFMAKPAIAKPEIIEAFQWNGYNEEDWEAVKNFINVTGEVEVHASNDDNLEIKTRESWDFVKVGHYVFRDINGNIASCTAEVFQETYEIVEDEL